MKWRMSLIENRTVILIETQGTMTVDSINQLVVETTAFATKHETQYIIVDHRKVTLDLTFMQLFNRPAELDKAKKMRSTRIAEIIPEKYKKEFKFFETVSRNRGYNIMIFDDYDLALKWLHEE